MLSLKLLEHAALARVRASALTDGRGRVEMAATRWG